MDDDGLPIIGPGVDYTQVGAIHQKRTLAFINHFISNTVSFLNKFSRSCELRLEKFDAQIQKLEASLSILEAKLNSISGLENVIVEQHITADKTNIQSEKSETGVQNSEMNDDTITEQDCLQSDPAEERISLAHDPQYARFFRMVQVGVPVQAVRLKMQAEGLDPNILDNPNMVVPAVPKMSNDNHSDSSFSD